MNAGNGILFLTGFGRAAVPRAVAVAHAAAAYCGNLGKARLDFCLKQRLPQPLRFFERVYNHLTTRLFVHCRPLNLGAVLRVEFSNDARGQRFLEQNNFEDKTEIPSHAATALLQITTCSPSTPASTVIQSN